MPKSLKEKKAYRDDNPIISSFQCAFLIDKEKLNFKDTVIFDIPPIEIGTTMVDRLLLKEYSYLSPNKKKVVIQAFIIQNMKDYDFWNQLKISNINDYNFLKQNIGFNIMDKLIEKNNSLKDNINLLDTWTPITYNTYFNSYYGSYMGFVFTKKKKIHKISPRINNIKNMFYLSYFQNIIGGLPVAAELGSSVSKYL